MEAVPLLTNRLHYHNSKFLTVHLGVSRLSPTAFPCAYFNSTLLPPSSSSDELLRGVVFLRFSNGRNTDFVVCSTHSNPRILKYNRRSQYGQQLSTYDDESVEGSTFSVDEYAETELNSDFRSYTEISSTHSEAKTKYRQGIRRSPRKEQEGSLKTVKGKSGNVYHATQQWQEMGSVDTVGREKSKGSNLTKIRLLQMSEFDFDEKWFPLIKYLSTFGLKESHFIQIYERHMPCLQINVASAQERLEFLLSLGVKPRDIRKIILRQPQILEYTVENNLKAHVAFLVSLGVPDSRIGQIITAAPSLFSYSVDNSLKPTVRYLVEEVGINKNDLGKVVQLSPQILVQRIDNSWTSRFSFLSKELGAPRESIVKMVTKHPQLLHYSIEDGILPRINFLRSIGMRNVEILKVLTGLTQVLSLSLENNLKPKYLYLVNELRNEVKSLTKYPTYLSLSLDQRIRPRHRFLVSLKKVPKGPFPLSSLVPTDECFCQQWAGTSLEKYLAFRQTLLLTEFAKKYEKTGIPS